MCASGLGSGAVGRGSGSRANQAGVAASGASLASDARRAFHACQSVGEEAEKIEKVMQNDAL